MPRELQPILDAVLGFLGSPVVALVGQAAGVYLVVLWLAASYWTFRDVQERSANPVAPYLASAFVIASTPILFPLAVILYRLVRPHEKVGEVTERTLAEEALLAELEAIPHCPSCGRRVHQEWVVCPTCRTPLHRLCPGCGRLADVEWAVCAWCGRDLQRREGGDVRGVVRAPDAGDGSVPEAAGDSDPGALGRGARPVPSGVRRAVGSIRDR